MEKNSLNHRLREFIENETRSCSMDFGCITPLYVYRMLGGRSSMEEIKNGLTEIQNQGFKADEGNRQKMLDKVSQQAKESSRMRVDNIIHQSFDDMSHRFFKNAVETQDFGFVFLEQRRYICAAGETERALHFNEERTRMI